jgi:hypothetical protein
LGPEMDSVRLIILFCAANIFASVLYLNVKPGNFKRILVPILFLGGVINLRYCVIVMVIDVINVTKGQLFPLVPIGWVAAIVLCLLTIATSVGVGYQKRN